MPDTVVGKREVEMTARTALRIHGLISAFGMFAMGLLLWQKEKTFASQDIYRAMAAFITEDHLAAMFLTLGVLRVVMIGFAFSRPESDLRPTIISCVLAFVSASIWFGGSLLFAQVNPIGVSRVTWSMLAAYDVSTAIMVARMIGTTHRRIRLSADRKPS